LALGLVDRIGNIDDAVASVARMAKVTDYQLREFPEPKSPFDFLFSNYKKYTRAETLKSELGEEGWQLYSRIKQVREEFGRPQARLPYDMKIE
jgi:protease-4